MQIHKTLIYIILSIFIILFAFLNFDGYDFYDDYSYAYYAYQLQNGTYQIATPDIFAHRWGIIAPLALLYYFFGISDAVNITLPLITTLLSLFLVFRFIKNIDNPSAIILILLFIGLDFYTLFFANKLYPDVLLTTLALASVFIFLERQNSIKKAFFFILFSFWAFLCKELIIYFFPFYLSLFFWDLRNKKHLLFWMYSVFFGVLFTVIYAGLYKYHTNNWLYRFSLIQDSHYIVNFSYFDKPFIYTLKRITYAPFLMFINTGLMITMAGGLALFCFPKAILIKAIKLILLLILMATLMFWFFSTHFTAYNPIGLFPRHILFLMPFFAILSGYAISLKNKRITFSISIIWVLSGLYAYTSVGIKYSLLYMILALSLIIILFIPKLFNLYYVFLGIILLIHPVYTMLKPTKTGYQDEKYVIQTHLKKSTKPAIIFTDDKLSSGYLWYYKFQKPANIEFKEFSEYENHRNTNKNVYILLNEYSIGYFRLIGYPLPSYTENISQEWKKIVTVGRVHLYKKP
ncbi:MAG: hypothetical protein MUC49_00055 [Raineya sp.]|jgi:hypothetical protein|nr:hypothetical protein [Raineya sp.]